MTNIKLRFLGGILPVCVVDLEYVTALEIVEAAKGAGVLPPDSDLGYFLVGKNGYAIYYDEREKTLSELGFSDGDTILVVRKPKFSSA